VFRPGKVDQLMSMSLYRSQVDRLMKEIADLERKAADGRGRATKERRDALRKSSSLRSTTSATTLQSRMREIQRHEERAVQHERRAADYGKQIAAKQRSLTSAQTSFERASAEQRRKDEQAARRRREDDLRHIRRLEDARPAATGMTQPWLGRSLPAGVHRLPASDSASTHLSREQAVRQFEWDVCLSFASEQRDYVKMIAAGLKKRDLDVFYDDDETVALWGKDLAEQLDYVYRKASRYCVIFVSEEYAAKTWTRHERRSALARALEEEGEYVLPERFDDTELPGLRPTLKYVDLRAYAPETVVEFIVQKVRGTQAAGLARLSG
jgi:TIR domain